MALKQIDQDTVYPNGKRGLPGRATTTLINENTAETEQRLAALEGGSGSVSAAIEALEQEQAALQTDIAGEAHTRAAMDAALDARIDAEQIARQAADTALGLRIPGKNRLINGNFDVWQTGISFGVSSYTADQWALNFGAVLTPAADRGTVAPGDTTFPGSTYYMRLNSTGNSNAAGHFMLIEQPIEDVRQLAGGAVAYSLNLWNEGAAGRQVAFEFAQVFGGGGSATVNIPVGKHTLVAGANRITGTINLPSIAGKTVGTNPNLRFILWLTAGTDFATRTSSLGPQSGAVRVGLMQVEPGSVATAFEYLPLATELARCQRYYCKTYSLDTPPGTPNQDPGRVASGTQLSGVSAPSFQAYGLRFPVSMRSSPSVIIYGAVSGVAGKVTVSDNSDTTGAATVRGINTGGCEVNWGNNANTFGGWFHYTADARF